MKAISSLLVSLALLLFLLTTITAQSNEDKRNPALMADEAPWGMMIVFTPGTTITQANQLRLEHGLVLLLAGYQGSDGRSYGYTYADDSQYPRFARRYYLNAGCSPGPEGSPQAEAKLCPPITPISAYYEPVNETTETALLADPHVAKLDNRNDQGFFFVSMIKALIEVIWQRWTNDPTGPVASS